MKLKHQQQPTDGSCMHACLAMLADIPVADVAAKFPWEPLGSRVFTSAVATLCLEQIPMLINNDIMFPFEGLYYVTVTSPNMHLTHVVLFEVTSHYDYWNIKVFDPELKEPVNCVGIDQVDIKFQWKMIDAMFLKPMCKRARNQFAELLILNERL